MVVENALMNLHMKWVKFMKDILSAKNVLVININWQIKENVKNVMHCIVINVIMKVKIKFAMNVLQDIILKITHVFNVIGYFYQKVRYVKLAQMTKQNIIPIPVNALLIIQKEILINALNAQIIVIVVGIIPKVKKQNVLIAMKGLH